MGELGTLELPLLRERQARTMDYLRGADVQFSAAFERIMRHTFAYADPLCASLVLWACDACEGDSETAVPVAASVECLYRFSVLHDELQMTPTLSFERESTSSIWGLAQTLNAGDAFHALGLGLLAKDAVHRERVLDVGMVLAHTVLHGVEQRNRLIRANARVRGERRLRVAYAGTHPSMLALSLRAGGMMAGAAPQLVELLARAGRLLGAIMQLASQAAGHSSPAAARYAAKAVALVEGSSLDPIYRAEFKEIAYELAAGR